MTILKEEINYTIKEWGTNLFYHFPDTPSYDLTEQETNTWTEKLETYVNGFLAQAYGDVPYIHVKLVERIYGRALGSFCSNSQKDTNPIIKISSRFLKGVELLSKIGWRKQEEAYNLLHGVLKHEAIHYALYHYELSNTDGSLEFETDLFLTGTPPSQSTDPEKVFCTMIPCKLDFYYLGCCPKCEEQFGVLTYKQRLCRNLCRQEDGEPLRILPDKGVMIRFEGEREFGELEPELAFTGMYTGKLKNQDTTVYIKQ